MRAVDCARHQGAMICRLGKGVKSRQTAVSTAGDVQPRATSATCHLGSSLPKKITFCCALATLQAETPALPSGLVRDKAGMRSPERAARPAEGTGSGSINPAGFGEVSAAPPGLCSVRGPQSCLVRLHPPHAASPRLFVMPFIITFWSTSPIRKCKKIPSACQLTHV